MRREDPGTVTQHHCKSALSTAHSKNAVVPGAPLGMWQVLRKEPLLSGLGIWLSQYSTCHTSLRTSVRFPEPRSGKTDLVAQVCNPSWERGDSRCLGLT